MRDILSLSVHEQPRKITAWYLTPDSYSYVRMNYHTQAEMQTAGFMNAHPGS